MSADEGLSVTDETIAAPTPAAAATVETPAPAATATVAPPASNSTSPASWSCTNREYGLSALSEPMT